MQENEPVKNETGWEEETDLSQKLAKHLKFVCEAYEAAASSSEKINLNLYVFPKLMETIKEIETENIHHRERGEEEIHVAEFPDFKKLVRYGLIEEDNVTTHDFGGEGKTVHHNIGHLSGIKEIVKREADQNVKK